MTSHRCDVLVLFGATGDLAYKQIFPALFSLFKRGRLNIPVVGIARSKLSQAEFHQRAKASLTTAALSVNETEFAAFASNLRYVSGDYTDPATFEHLERELSTYSFPLFYMARDILKKRSTTLPICILCRHFKRTVPMLL